MTIVIGQLCSNGIVIGADGACTLNRPDGSYTSRMPIKKLCLVDKSLIYGFSGDVGFSQQLFSAINNLWNKKELVGKSLHQAREILRLRMYEATKNEFAIAEQTKNMFPPNWIISQSLIAVILDHKPCLIQFDHLFAATSATDELSFFSIGCGQNIADPFLAFLKEVFWKNRLPNLSEGIFTVLWTLRHAIRTSPGGVSDPIQVAVLESNGTEGSARFLEEGELEGEHQQAIQGVEEYLRNFQIVMQQPKEGSVVKLPTKPIS